MVQFHVFISLPMAADASMETVRPQIMHALIASLYFSYEVVGARTHTVHCLLLAFLKWCGELVRIM